jgi:hypothetical protein
MNGNVQTLSVVNGMWKSVGWSWSQVMAVKRKVRAKKAN